MEKTKKYISLKDVTIPYVECIQRKLFLATA